MSVRRTFQSNFVRVLKGKVLDVVANIRKDSPVFGQLVSVDFSDENQRLLFIFHHCLYGFSVLSENAIVAYKVDNFCCKESGFGIAYNDSDMALVE